MRDEGLQENGEKRDDEGDRNAEPVNLDLLAGCVSNGHVIAECPATGWDQKQLALRYLAVSRRPVVRALSQVLGAQRRVLWA